MNLPSLGNLDALDLLFTLFPGLLTYLIVRLLTAREKKLDAVDAILYGLAYTLLVHFFWAVAKWPGPYIPTPDIIGLGFIAIATGVAISLSTKHRGLYRLLRFLGVTDEPEFPTIWKTAFRTSRDEVGDYVVLSLDDGRRLMGESRAISEDHRDGHVMLARWDWLRDDVDDTATPEFTTSSGWILVDANKIETVHFLPRKGRQNE